MLNFKYKLIMSLILLFLIIIIIFKENHSEPETLYFRIESGRPRLFSETIPFPTPTIIIHY